MDRASSRSVPWAAQQLAFTAWMNGRLAERDGFRVEDLQRDMRDGVVLLELLEIVDRGHVFAGRVRRPRHKLEEIANLNLGIERLRERGVKLVNISAEDVHDGSIDLILALVWAIILRFELGTSAGATGGSARSGDSDDASGARATAGGLNDARHELLVWVRAQLETAAGASNGAKPAQAAPAVSNLTHDFRSGEVLVALAERALGAPSLGRAADPSAPPVERVRAAMGALESQLGVPHALSADELVAGQLDERAAVVYVAMLRRAVERRDAASAELHAAVNARDVRKLTRALDAARAAHVDQRSVLRASELLLRLQPPAEPALRARAGMQPRTALGLSMPPERAVPPAVSASAASPDGACLPGATGARGASGSAHAAGGARPVCAAEDAPDAAGGTASPRAAAGACVADERAHGEDAGAVGEDAGGRLTAGGARAAHDAGRALMRLGDGGSSAASVGLDLLGRESFSDGDDAGPRNGGGAGGRATAAVARTALTAGAVLMGLGATASSAVASPPRANRREPFGRERDELRRAGAGGDEDSDGGASPPPHAPLYAARAAAGILHEIGLSARVETARGVHGQRGRATAADGRGYGTNDADRERAGGRAGGGGGGDLAYASHPDARLAQVGEAEQSACGRCSSLATAGAPDVRASDGRTSLETQASATAAHARAATERALRAARSIGATSAASDALPLREHGARTGYERTATANRARSGSPPARAPRATAAHVGGAAAAEGAAGGVVGATHGGRPRSTARRRPASARRHRAAHPSGARVSETGRSSGGLRGGVHGGAFGSHGRELSAHVEQNAPHRLQRRASSAGRRASGASLGGSGSEFFYRPAMGLAWNRLRVVRAWSPSEQRQVDALAVRVRRRLERVDASRRAAEMAERRAVLERERRRDLALHGHSAAGAHGDGPSDDSAFARWRAQDEERLLRLISLRRAELKRINDERAAADTERKAHAASAYAAWALGKRHAASTRAARTAARDNAVSAALEQILRRVDSEVTFLAWKRAHAPRAPRAPREEPRPDHANARSPRTADGEPLFAQRAGAGARVRAASASRARRTPATSADGASARGARRERRQSHGATRAAASAAAAAASTAARHAAARALSWDEEAAGPSAAVDDFDWDAWAAGDVQLDRAAPARMRAASAADERAPPAARGSGARTARPRSATRASRAGWSTARS
ncbi:hypothetical protein KFE25_006672 [Diacronema lutheri]|uniref:Calponin-homology (CH) domain-containing protein n=1 Tax=Diacronema lutheri TaxID=2081491 RepID=A0A8J5XY64_DIALT|nr:hypothetical protein KFE25_006672 [Diacronema lutheri]